MSATEIVAVVAAGIAAGMINTLVGSGTLITFPILLGLGVAPVVANVSNNIGLVPGTVSGVIGYRRELRGQGGRILRLGSMSVAGGLAGAAALLVLPPGAFKAIVPAFIVVAVVLVVLQPWLNALIAERRERRQPTADADGARAGEGAATRAGVLATGIYGGYFGAAQGIMLLGLLGVTLPEDLQRVNALKNVLAGLVNLVAGIVFVFAAEVDWLIAGLIAAGSVVGGALGARYGRRLPPAALRGVVVPVGVFAILRLLVL